MSILDVGVGLARGGDVAIFPKLLIVLPKLLIVHAMNLIYRPGAGSTWGVFVIHFTIHVAVLFDIDSA